MSLAGPAARWGYRRPDAAGWYHGWYTGVRVDQEYANRRHRCLAEVHRHEHTHARLGLARLGLAGLAGATAWFGGTEAWPWLAAEGLAFLALTIIHTRIINARDRAQRAVDFYTRGLARIEGTWQGTGDAGERYLEGPGSEGPGSEGPGSRVHLYEQDLDVFGRGSLFELLGTCRTELGQATLAGWLRDLPPADVTRLRQLAIRELAPQLDLREALAVEGEAIAQRMRPDLMREWAAAPPLLPTHAGLSALVALLPASLLAAVIWRLNGGPGGIVELALLTQTGVALALRSRVVPVIGRVDAQSRNLELLVRSASLIESSTFQSPALVALQRRLGGGPGGQATASAAIARLARLDALLASRQNVMFAPLALLLLWGTQLAFRVEAWRRRHGPHVSEWLDAIGEFEALAALAGFAAEHPAFVWPEVQDATGPRFEAAALAHPLLPASAVANDVTIGGTGPALLLVSGSNMSGKSTFLRAMGLTVVLARVGAPVRARACTLSPLAIGASIRVTDSLLDGQSRFFAEILRLRHVVDLACATGGQMIFLLDEMLSGTNSHDRRHGAEGVLRGLTRLGAIGLATTHDLALGAIVDTLDQPAAQVHFSDVFDAGTLQFDYVLRPGPVRTSNALALMRSVGLEVDER